MKRVTFGEPVHIIPSIQFRILKMGNSTSVVTVGKRAESEYSYYGVNKGRKSMAKCMGRIAAIALIGTVFLLISFKVHSDVISGTGVLTWGEWDFSESEACDYIFCGDITVIDVFDPPIGLVVSVPYVPGLIICLPDSSFQDLEYAPEDTLAYGFEVPAYPNVTYVVRTLEGHYAKFRFTVPTFQSIIIEYVYQPDGPRDLFDRIGTKGQSWGAIKALYK